MTRPPVPPVGPAPLPLIETTLANGLRMSCLSLPDREMAVLHVVVHGGDRVEPASRSGLAGVLASVRALDGALIDRLERLGATLSGEADHDAAHLTAVCPGERLDGVAELVADVLMVDAPTFGDAPQVTSRRLAAIRAERAHPLHRARDAVRRLAYAPGSPYGRNAGGDEESVSGLTPPMLAECHHRQYGPANTSVLVAGDLDRWRGADRAAKMFESWRHDVLPVPPPSISPAAAATWELVPAPLSSQATLMLGGAVLTPDLPSLSALEVAVHALGGWFGARLNLVLRERLGYTYGFHAEFHARKLRAGYAGEFQVYGSLDAATLQPAISTLFRECVGEALAEGEILRARDNLASRELMFSQTPRKISMVTGTRMRRGFGVDELTGRGRLLLDLPPSAVVRAAEEFLTPARLSLVAVGDPTVCEIALSSRAARLGVRMTRAC